MFSTAGMSNGTDSIKDNRAQGSDRTLDVVNHLCHSLYNSLFRLVKYSEAGHLNPIKYQSLNSCKYTHWFLHLFFKLFLDFQRNHATSYQRRHMDYKISYQYVREVLLLYIWLWPCYNCPFSSLWSCVHPLFHSGWLVSGVVRLRIRGQCPIRQVLCPAAR